MYDRLQAVEDRYDELNELLSDPDVVSDPKTTTRPFQRTIRHYRDSRNVPRIQKCKRTN